MVENWVIIIYKIKNVLYCEFSVSKKKRRWCRLLCCWTELEAQQEAERRVSPRWGSQWRCAAQFYMMGINILIWAGLKKQTNHQTCPLILWWIFISSPPDWDLSLMHLWLVLDKHGTMHVHDEKYESHLLLWCFFLFLFCNHFGYLEMYLLFMSCAIWWSFLRNLKHLVASCEQRVHVLYGRPQRDLNPQPRRF